MGLEHYQKNGLSVGSRLPPVPASLPLSQGRQTPYFAANTRAFLRERAQYADNLYEAQIQGMNPDNPMELQWYRIRVEDVINNSAVSSNMYEGWKMVFFEDPDVEAMPRETGLLRKSGVRPLCAGQGGGKGHRQQLWGAYGAGKALPQLHYGP